jgi:VIT1/CCC1 family predicted Fe2+/Mn2+ transporter
MNGHVEQHDRAWSAAVRLAAIASIVAAAIAVVASSAGNVPQAAVVLPVIVVAFAVSWVQSGRTRRNAAPARVTHTVLRHAPAEPVS